MQRYAKKVMTVIFALFLSLSSVSFASAATIAAPDMALVTTVPDMGQAMALPATVMPGKLSA